DPCQRAVRIKVIDKNERRAARARLARHVSEGVSDTAAGEIAGRDSGGRLEPGQRDIGLTRSGIDDSGVVGAEGLDGGRIPWGCTGDQKTGRQRSALQLLKYGASRRAWPGGANPALATHKAALFGSRSLKPTHEPTPSLKSGVWFE